MKPQQVLIRAYTGPVRVRLLTPAYFDICLRHSLLPEAPYLFLHEGF